jgi:hypothetical protein
LNKDTYKEELESLIYPPLKLLNSNNKLLIFFYVHYLREEQIAEFVQQYNRPIKFRQYTDEELNEIVKELYKDSKRPVN